MTKSRKNQYDFLRIIATVAVVLIHSKSSNTYFDQFILTLCGVGVPIFFYLTGLFLIEKNYNRENLEKYYIERFRKIVLPTIIFFVLYFLYCIVISYYKDNSSNISNIVSLLIERWIDVGIPGEGYHLWFMNILIPIYLFIPLISYVKHKSINIYYSIFIILFVFSEINFYFLNINTKWYFEFIYYIPFVILGDLVNSIIINNNNKISNNHLVLILTIILLVEFSFKILSIAGYQSSFIALILNEKNKLYVINDPDSRQLLNLLASVVVFAIFKSINVNKDLHIMSDLMFYVYLIHFGLENIVNRTLVSIFNIFGLSIIEYPWYWLLIRGLIVFIISYYLAKFVKYIYYKILNYFKL